MAETTHKVSNEPGELTFGRLRLGATNARSNGWLRHGDPSPHRGLPYRLSAVRPLWAGLVPRGGVLSAGGGRAQLMAIGGFFAALLLTAAIAFNTVSGFWQGLCPL